MLTIDGSVGEGGGQMLRSSLSLAMVTQTPFRMVNIRAKREKPGLLRQHLTAVRAAVEISGGEAIGAELRSKELVFRPGKVRGGSYTFSIGTAGSTTLVLQAILPALMLAPEASTVELEGGTHNPLAPSFESLTQSFLPLLARQGPRVRGELISHGFAPAGGGRCRFEITPTERLKALVLTERGALRSQSAKAIVVSLPRTIGERELAALSRALAWGEAVERSVESEIKAVGPGNVLSVVLESEHVTEVFTGFGEKGIPAERVATMLAREVHRYLEAEVPVGEYLADQLLLPIALAGRGAIQTTALSTHTETQLEVLNHFLGVQFKKAKVRANVWSIELGG